MKYVIVAVMPGCEMFISSSKADVSDKVSGALVFDSSVDNVNIKVSAFKRMTGIDNWAARFIG